jgi:hypothetical protein
MRLVRTALLGAALLAAPALAQPSQPKAPASPDASATAATAESRAAARELMAALETEKQSEQVMVLVSRQITAALAQASGKPVAEVERIVDEVLMPEFRTRMPELTAFNVELWAGLMSAPELRELKAFYDTPLGRRMQMVTPQVAAAAAAFGMTWGQDVGMSALAKHREALRARGLKI